MAALRTERLWRVTDAQLDVHTPLTVLDARDMHAHSMYLPVRDQDLSPAAGESHTLANMLRGLCLLKLRAKKSCLLP